MRLLRTQEVAKRLGLHPASVRRLAARGAIPYVQAGGWRLFEARAVEALRRRRGKALARRADTRPGGPTEPSVNVSSAPEDATLAPSGPSDSSNGHVLLP